MSDNKYCDIKRYFKNEHTEYYRLLKDKLCTGMIFSNVPKCFLVPQGKLLEDLKNTSSTEELSNKVKHLILKSNVELHQIGNNEELVNINNKILNDTKSLLSKIKNLSKGSVYKPWMHGGDKKSARGNNTVYVYEGDKLPEATTDSTKSNAKMSKGKKGGFWPSSGNEQNKYKLFANLLNSLKSTVTSGDDNVKETCNRVQNHILFVLKTLGEHENPYYSKVYNKLLLFAYYPKDPVISVVSIVKLLSLKDFSAVLSQKTEKVNLIINANAQNLNEMSFGLINGDELKKNFIEKRKNFSNDVDTFNFNSSSMNIRNNYMSLCEGTDVDWNDKLLVDEIKYIYSNQANKSNSNKLRGCLMTVMSNKNIIYYEDVMSIEILRNDLSENMMNFIKSDFYGYRDTNITGGSHNQHSMVLKALEQQYRSLEKVISQLKHKKGGVSGGDENDNQTETVSESVHEEPEEYVGGKSDPFGGFLGGYESD